MQEGLFGGIVTFVMSVLPYLSRHGIKPIWSIKSRLYGRKPDYEVIPGIFDLAYLPESKGERVKLQFMMKRFSCVLGNDFEYLHELFFSFFSIPYRIRQKAEEIVISQQTLGIHYRGTDKNKSIYDTNPVSIDQFIEIIVNFLKENSRITAIYVATDETEFMRRIAKEFPAYAVANLDVGRHHKDLDSAFEQAELALADAYNLSRCGIVLKCSSALSAFSKVINPKLPIFRIAASKAFAFGPYYLDGHIPRLVLKSEKANEMIDALYEGDWEESLVYRCLFGHAFQTQSNTYLRLYDFLLRVRRKLRQTKAAIFAN